MWSYWVDASCTFIYTAWATLFYFKWANIFSLNKGDIGGISKKILTENLNEHCWKLEIFPITLTNNLDEIWDLDLMILCLQVLNEIDFF